MAHYFGLDVDFGDNEAGVEAARHLINDGRTLRAGAHQVPLHPSTGPGPRIVAVPVGVGLGLPAEIRARTDHLHPTADELGELGRGLYGLLRQFTGYRMAVVGWDLLDGWLDLAELRETYAEELATGDLPGLVVSDDVRRSLADVPGFEPFEPGYQWIPYRGETST